MKHYRIKKSFHGSQTGIDTKHFLAGETHPLSESLASKALAEGWIEEHKPEEEKAIPEAPANKMKATAPENKSRKSED